MALIKTHAGYWCETDGVKSWVEQWDEEMSSAEETFHHARCALGEHQETMPKAATAEQTVEWLVEYNTQFVKEMKIKYQNELAKWEDGRKSLYANLLKAHSVYEEYCKSLEVKNV